MNNENATGNSKTLTKRVLTFVIRGVLGVLALCVIASWVWCFSGSNKWEFAGENAGVKLYTLKSPGASDLQFKTVGRVHSSLSNIVSAFRDPAFCRKCTDPQVYQQSGNHLMYLYFAEDTVFPFSKRDFAMRLLTNQDPDTKEVLISITADLNKAPLKDCCVRVVRMNNTWKLTPVGNGEVDVEYIYNTDLGGFASNIVVNVALYRTLIPGMHTFVRLFAYNEKNHKYPKLDFIQEP